MATIKEVAALTLEKLGGKSNVTANATCMTRLHVRVTDQNKVDMEGLKKVEGVLGVVNGETIQIVFGPGKVNKVGDAFSTLTGIAIGSESADVNKLASAKKDELSKKYDKPVQRFFKHFANIFVPLLPGIIAAGMINGILNVVKFQTAGAYNNQWWFALIATMGWALFLYLPILVGQNAAKEFRGSPVLGAMAGALSVSVSSMPLLATFGTAKSVILLPLTNAQFVPANGGLLAALFAGIFFAYLERFTRKYVPEILDTFLTPLITVIVGGVVTLLLIQPLGTFLGQAIYGGMDFLYNKMGVIGGYILSAGFLPLVSVGLHRVLTPIHTLLNNPTGPTKGINYLLPILMMAGGGQVGAGFALYLRTKSKALKNILRASIPVGILGVGEPLMYAVSIPLGKPFITACLGAGVGGVVAQLFHVGAISQGVSGLFGLLIIVPGFQVYYVIGMLAAYASGFALTYFFAFDEGKIEDLFGE